MNRPKSYFFCGIGGSGMMPLALIMRAKGASVAGSDRAYDQGRTLEKFAFLEKADVRLFPQDGSGVQDAETVLVASAAVEATVPDVAAAIRLGAPRMTRAELLSSLFNAAEVSIGVAGTSGKSTTTAMIAWILAHAGEDPTVINGAVMANFVSDEQPFASARVGAGPAFVCEVDESDGSIAGYDATVAVITNISHDHKSMEELRSLFAGYAKRAQSVVTNLDNPETASLAAPLGAKVSTFSVEKHPEADYYASQVSLAPDGVNFRVSVRGGASMLARLAMPGRHNVANAVAAVAACEAVGVSAERSVPALASFAGVRRRLERVGMADGVAVIDDFAHNPDKIAATLSTLKQHPGRLLILFQPHGFRPLALMRGELVDAFAEHLGAEDTVMFCDPAYFGGTTERVVTSEDLIGDLSARGLAAQHIPERAAAGRALVQSAAPGDRIVVMGARDDSLSVFAKDLVAALEAAAKAKKGGPDGRA